MHSNIYCKTFWDTKKNKQCLDNNPTMQWYFKNPSHSHWWFYIWKTRTHVQIVSRYIKVVGLTTWRTVSCLVLILSRIYFNVYEIIFFQQYKLCLKFWPDRLHQLFCCCPFLKNKNVRSSHSSLSKEKELFGQKVVDSNIRNCIHGSCSSQSKKSFVGCNLLYKYLIKHYFIFKLSFLRRFSFF